MELHQTRIKRGMDFLLEGVIREGTGIGLSKVIVHKEETEGQADKEKHLQKGIIVRAGHLVRIEIQEGGRNRGFKGQGDSKSPERARNDKGRQERSSSRAEGSPMRLQGCLRCSSSNHRASSCTRFQRWEGSKCKICGYLHNSRFCPFAAKNQDYRSKDNRSRDNGGEKNLLKDNDNSYRNAYQVQVVKSEDNSQRSDQEEYIPKVPQPTARQNNSSNVFTKN